MENQIQKYDALFSSAMKEKIVLLSIVSLITAAILEWLPVFSFFAPVPLFYLLFLQGKRYFLLSLPIVVVLSVINSFIVYFFKGIPVDTNLFLMTFAGVGISLVPLSFFALPAMIKTRYRVFIASISSVVLWLLLNSLINFDSHIESLFSQVLLSLEETPFVSSDYSVDYIVSFMMTIVRYSIAPASFIMYAFSWKIANSLAYNKTHGAVQKFNLLLFFNDHYMVYFLSFAMLGIISNYFIQNALLAIVAWNILIVSLLWFSLQGYAIFIFLIRHISKNKKQPKILFFVFSFGLIITNGWILFLGVLMIAGVVEYFIPIRTRFKHIDSADPTPGRGTDHKE